MSESTYSEDCLTELQGEPQLKGKECSVMVSVIDH